jgi:hypothetical protein
MTQIAISLIKMSGVIGGVVTAIDNFFGIFFPGAKLRKGLDFAPGRAPCMAALDDIKLPMGSGQICPRDPEKYVFSFFSGPVQANSNLVSEGLPFEYPSGIPGEPDVLYTVIKPLRPGVTFKNAKKFIFSGPINSGATINAPSVVQPINMMPYITSTKFTAYKFPSSTDLVAIITPGPQKNNTNVVSGPGLGLTNTLYIDIQKDCSLYVELAGGRGGTFPVYANGVNFQNVAIPLTPGFIGGHPGTVFGLLSCKKGDILKVFLGSVGVETDANSNSVTTNNPFQSGQGGIGTIFGGANGGGASYIVRFRNIFDAYSNSNGDILAVAAGGGGASRNASGGFAGNSADGLQYGQKILTKPSGSAGGLSNVVDLAPILLRHRENDLSGGGGTLTVGGLSSITDTPERNSSWGQKITPFEDSGFVPVANGHSGGGSVITFSGSGGGGGGGGYYGGGAGAWNLLPKPNNLHGAGGGGSSYSTLKPATRDNSTINVYRRIDDTSISQILPNNVPESPLYGFGFLVLGVKNSEVDGNIVLN